MNFLKTLFSAKPTDDEIVIHLSKVLLFDNLSLNDLEELALEIKAINFDKGQNVFNEADESDGMFIIHQGGVNVIKKDKSGDEIVIVTLGAFDYFGEMSLIDNIKRTATVRAIIPTTAYFLSNFILTLSKRLELTTKSFVLT